MYGDSAYPLLPTLKKAYTEDTAPPNINWQQINTAFSRLRTAGAEWRFGHTSQLNAFVDFHKNHKALLQQVSVYYYVATFFVNLRHILRGNQVSY